MRVYPRTGKAFLPLFVHHKISHIPVWTLDSVHEEEHCRQLPADQGETKDRNWTDHEEFTTLLFLILSYWLAAQTKYLSHGI